MPWLLFVAAFVGVRQLTPLLLLLLLLMRRRWLILPLPLQLALLLLEQRQEQRRVGLVAFHVNHGLAPGLRGHIHVLRVVTSVNVAIGHQKAVPLSPPLPPLLLLSPAGGHCRGCKCIDCGRASEAAAAAGLVLAVFVLLLVLASGGGALAF